MASASASTLCALKGTCALWHNQRTGIGAQSQSTKKINTTKHQGANAQESKTHTKNDHRAQQQRQLAQRRDRNTNTKPKKAQRGAEGKHILPAPRAQWQDHLRGGARPYIASAFAAKVKNKARQRKYRKQPRKRGHRPRRGRTTTTDTTARPRTPTRNQDAQRGAEG